MIYFSWVWPQGGPAALHTMYFTFIGGRKYILQQKFKESQIKLKTTTVICDAFSAILGSLRSGNGQPKLASYFETEIGTMIQDAWKEHEAIGWDNMLKGWLRKLWGYDQAKYYQLNPHTSD